MLIQSLFALSLLAAPPQEPMLSADGQAVETAIQAYAGKTNDERRDAVVAQLRERSFVPEVVPFQGGNERTGPRPGANVVVAVGQGDRDIVLTGHFDAVPLRDGTMAQGVVDNAGSVVALMEALSSIAQGIEGQPTSHRYVFVFTDQEELGLIGARKWLEAQDATRITAVINMDVNAWGETVMYGENVGEQSAFVLRALRLQCAEMAFNCIAFPNYPPSDDRVFSAAGVPVVSIGSQHAAGAHQMWLAFNGGESNGLAQGFVPPVFERIHSAQDTMEWVDGDAILRTSGFVADLAMRLARAD
jgi:Peptidase family M28